MRRLWKLNNADIVESSHAKQLPVTCLIWSSFPLFIFNTDGTIIWRNLPRDLMCLFIRTFIKNSIWIGSEVCLNEKNHILYFVLEIYMHIEWISLFCFLWMFSNWTILFCAVIWLFTSVVSHFVDRKKAINLRLKNFLIYCNNEVGI